MTDLSIERERISAARAQVLAEIDAAGGADVTIVAVTKTHPAAIVLEASRAGFTEFGESYAPEFVDKARTIADSEGSSWPGRWHFIGQLQTNKVRKVAPFVSLYQSVDRTSLIDEIARRDPGAGVLIQVNLSQVPGRGGADAADVPALVDAARRQGLLVDGVMGVAPQADPAVVGTAFAQLRAICDAEALAQCSMGMSHDYKIAISEGATMLRLGSILFGERD